MLDLPRLSRVIAMFDSPNTAERTAAFLRADAMITGAGRKWRDALPAIFGNTVRLGMEDGGHVEQCRELLRRYRDAGIMTRWETNFLISLCGFTALTPRQIARLDQLCEEVELRVRAQDEFGDLATAS